MNHKELAIILRKEIINSSKTLRQIEQETGISRSFLSAFSNGKTVCFDILNRLANYFDIEYQITNEYAINKPDVYIDNILDLIFYLRDQLRVEESVMKVVNVTGLKKSGLYNFRKGDAICLMKMDILCKYYSIIYKIRNHPEELTENMGWAT